MPRRPCAAPQTARLPPQYPTPAPRPPIPCAQLGRWASLMFTTWQELCFTSGVHPFTGARMGASQETQADEAKGAAGPKARGGGGGATPAAPAARAELQSCFMRACGTVQDQLTREMAGLVSREPDCSLLFALCCSPAALPPSCIVVLCMCCGGPATDLCSPAHHRAKRLHSLHDRNHPRSI